MGDSRLQPLVLSEDERLVLQGWAKRRTTAHKAPVVHKWLLAHPRFELHFTPTYSSWINQGPPDHAGRPGTHEVTGADEVTAGTAVRVGARRSLPYDDLDQLWPHLGLRKDAPREVKKVKLREVMSTPV